MPGKNPKYSILVFIPALGGFFLVFPEFWRVGLNKVILFHFLGMQSSLGFFSKSLFFFFNLFLVLNYNSIGNEEIFGENLAEGFCDPGGFLGIWGWGFVGFAPFLFHEEEKKKKILEISAGKFSRILDKKKVWNFSKIFPN